MPSKNRKTRSGIITIEKRYGPHMSTYASDMCHAFLVLGPLKSKGPFTLQVEHGRDTLKSGTIKKNTRAVLRL